MGAGEGCGAPETKDTGEVTETKRGERERWGEGRAGKRDGGENGETPTPGAGAQVPGEGTPVGH